MSLLAPGTNLLLIFFHRFGHDDPDNYHYHGGRGGYPEDRPRGRFGGRFGGRGGRSAGGYQGGPPGKHQFCNFFYYYVFVAVDVVSCMFSRNVL